MMTSPSPAPHSIVSNHRSLLLDFWQWIVDPTYCHDLHLYNRSMQSATFSSILRWQNYCPMHLQCTQVIFLCIRLKQMLIIFRVKGIE